MIKIKNCTSYSFEDRKAVVEDFLKLRKDNKTSLRKYAKKTGIDRTTIKKWIDAYNANNLKNYSQAAEKKGRVERPVAGGYITPPNIQREELRGSRFVFTSAQNNTNIHNAFFNNIKKFCETNNAKLIVGKFRYNKSGFQNYTDEADDDLWYDPKITKYIIDRPVSLSKSASGLVWCGELDILPTASNPISGLDSYTGTDSCIIPHAKVHLKSIARLKGFDCKMIYTTGAITQRNYIQRKAGQKAEFHHVFGALYVEIDAEGRHFCRQLIADNDGNFYDLDRHYHNGTVSHSTIEAINWGDIHAEMLDHDVASGAWRDEGNILDVLKPRFQFVHDLTDFKARNHHNRNNPHFLAERYFYGQNLVQEGMAESAQVLEELHREFSKIVVVESNHDLAFKKWLAEADIRHDPANAEYYHLANAEIYKQIRLGNRKFHAFEWAVRQFTELDNIEFLHANDSYIIAGNIECGMHGHDGINGSKGSPQSFRNIGRKVNLGHGHTAWIIDGVYMAGISCKLDMGYNKGPSSWSHSHIITYPNGKRAIITMRGNKWRA